MRADQPNEDDFDRKDPAEDSGRDTCSEPVSRDKRLVDVSKSLALAKRYLHQRGLRRTAFGADVFREPAWDVMLDLYCARLLGKEVSVMDACIAAGVPNTTGLRYVGRLLASGIVAKRRDALDKRRSWLDLTDEASDRVEAWLHATWPEGTSPG